MAGGDPGAAGAIGRSQPAGHAPGAGPRGTPDRGRQPIARPQRILPGRRTNVGGCGGGRPCGRAHRRGVAGLCLPRWQRSPGLHLGTRGRAERSGALIGGIASLASWHSLGRDAGAPWSRPASRNRRAAAGSSERRPAAPARPRSPTSGTPRSGCPRRPRRRLPRDRRRPFGRPAPTTGRGSLHPGGQHDRNPDHEVGVPMLGGLPVGPCRGSAAAAGPVVERGATPWLRADDRRRCSVVVDRGRDRGAVEVE